MPPPGTSLEPYKHVIWSWYILSHQTIEDTQKLLQYTYPALAMSYPGRDDFPCTRTLQRALNEWGFKKYNKPLDNTSELCHELWILFYDLGLNDGEIMRFLQRGGYMINKQSYVESKPEVRHFPACFTYY